MERNGYPHIVQRCRRVIRRYDFRSLLEAGGWLVLSGAAAVTIAALLEAVLYFAPPVKIALVTAVVLVSAGTGAGVCVRRMLHRPDVDGAARLVELRFPQLGNRLISAVQLGRLTPDHLGGQSSDLVDALVLAADRDTQDLPVEQAVPFRTLTPLLRAASAAVALPLLLGILAPGLMFGGLYRLADVRCAYQRPNLTTITLTRRPASVLRGEDYAIAGFVSGATPGELSLAYQWADGDTWQVRPVDIGADGSFAAVVERPQRSFAFQLEAGRSVTAEFPVTVIERPEVAGLTVILDYPAYTGRSPEQRTDGDGNIRALRGTMVTMTVTATKPLRELSIVWGDSTSTVCPVAGATGAARFAVDRSIDYCFALTDTLGITNEAPVIYRLTALDDLPPEVTMLSPAEDGFLPRTMGFPVIWRAGDDYGLSKVEFRYRNSPETDEHAVTLSGWNSGAALDGEYAWDLSGESLVPGQSVTFYLAAWDNDTVTGPKRAESEHRTVTVPSVADMLHDMVAGQEQGLEQLRGIAGRTADQSSRMDDVSEGIKRGREMDWTDRNTLDESRRELDDMRREMIDVAAGIEDMVDRLSDEDMLALDTVERMQRIADLMGGIADGEMKDALERLMSVQGDADPQKLKEAIDAYQVSARQIQEKLDRLIALLEQAQAVQRFETARSLLEDLAVEHLDVTESFQNDPSAADIARREHALAGETDDVVGQLRESVENLDSLFSVDTSSAMEQLGAVDPGSAMRDAADAVEQHDSSAAESAFDEANTRMSGLLGAMDSLSEGMHRRSTAEMRRLLFAAISDLSAVSSLQESFVNGSEPSDPQLRAPAQLEVAGAADASSRSLASLAAANTDLADIIGQIGPSVRLAMGAAVDSYATGDRAGGDRNARSALSLANSGINLLSNLLRQSGGMPMTGGMPGDFLQQLQQIADGQLSLQQQMGSGQMAQLMAEQRKLAEMLSELGRRALDDPRLRELLGGIAGDMDDTADMMGRNDPRELVERQQFDLYRRLLDARRSRREKDDADERRSWTAQENVSRGADSLTEGLGEHDLDLSRRSERALSEDFNPEWRGTIRSYFESLLRRGGGPAE